MSRPMRVLIVGAGSWGATIARRIHQGVPGLELAGIVDRHLGVAEGVAHASGTGWHTSITRAAQDTRIDAVVIATPPGADRPQLVAEAADAGIRRVRLEKPVADDPTTVMRIGSLALAGHLDVRVGHTPLHDECVDYLVKHAAPYARSMFAVRTGTRRPAHAPDPTLDLAVHDIALAHRLWNGGQHVCMTQQDDDLRVLTMIVDGGHREVPVLIEHGYSDTAQRTTQIDTTRGTFTYQEHAGRVLLNGDVVHVRDRDPLGIELEQWAAGGGVRLAFGQGVTLTALAGIMDLARREGAA